MSNRQLFMDLPAVTMAEMQKIDQDATQEWGIRSENLMEAAGRKMTVRMLGKRLAEPGGKAIVFCGRGNNGGDGLVIARYLKAAGVSNKIFIFPPKGPPGYGRLVEMNLERARACGVPIIVLDSGLMPAISAMQEADVIIDALMGTGTHGEPEDTMAMLINAINESGKTVVAVDVPSGINPDTGVPAGSCIKASATVMLGLPKVGLLLPCALPFTGELNVLDIGFPPELIANLLT